MASSGEDATTAKPLYKGSCHCGFVSYTVGLDLVNPSPETGSVLTKCNCSICHKSGTVLAIPAPGSLKILSPPEARADLQDYVFDRGNVHHWLCPKCGIKCFLEGCLTYQGQEIKFTRINVLTLDEKEDGSPLEDLRQLKPLYWDGKSISWEGDVPKGTPKAASKEPGEGGIW